VSHPFDMHHRTQTAILTTIAVACVALLVACRPSPSAKQTDGREADAKDTSVKRYILTGRVVSIDKPNQSINVEGDAIPGFMAAMTMPYQVKDASVLEKISPGDQIKAEIVVGKEGVSLENIVVSIRTPSQVPTK
jgi:protein SCO1/2